MCGDPMSCVEISDGSPRTMLNTPAGMPASINAWAKPTTEIGVSRRLENNRAACGKRRCDGAHGGPQGRVPRRKRRHWPNRPGIDSLRYGGITGRDRRP